MQALILAGGEGTRLRPLTTRVAKPVVPLANRPFITYMLDWLEGHGFDDIVMSCGFLAEGVREVLGIGRPQRHQDPLRRGDRAARDRRPGEAGRADARRAVRRAQRRHPHRHRPVVGGRLPRRARRARDADFDAGSRSLLLRRDRHGRRRGRGSVHREAAGQGPSNLINAGIYVLEREVVGEHPGRPRGRPSSARSSRRSSATACTGSSARATGSTSGRSTATCRRRATFSPARSRPP